MGTGSSVRLKKAASVFRIRKNSSQEADSFLNRGLNSREKAKALLTLAGILSLFSYVFYNSLLPVLFIIAPAAVFYLKRVSRRLAESRREQLKKEFLTGASLLGDYLKSGYSIENAIRGSVNELAEVWGENSDIVAEWNRMGKSMSLSMSAEEAFRDFGQRSGIEQIRDFSEIFSIVKRSGGRLDESVAAVTSLLSEQFAAEEQIRTMTAAKRYEQKIMNVMPVGILLYIRMSSPDLLSVMYASLTGRAIMTACLALYIAAYLWAERIISIRV